MQRKILTSLLIVAFFGLFLTTVAMYAAQTLMARSSAREMTLSSLDNVVERVRQNQIQIEDLVAAQKEDYLARARSLAMIIELDPDIIHDKSKLDEVVRVLDVDEIHIINEDGLLLWGTQPQYYGMHFGNYDQTRPFLAILDDPSVEIAQDLMPNAAIGRACQYSGVSLRNRKGIAQVGIYPERLEEALKNNQINNVLSGVTVGNNGYVFSVAKDTGIITSHPYMALVGAALPASLNESGFLNIDGQRVMYSTLNLEEQTLVAVVPISEIYAKRTYYTFIYLGFTIAVLSAISAILNRYIKRNVVDGILQTVNTLQEISAGNLDVVANIRSTHEFEQLSDGINHMLHSTKAKIAEIAALAEGLNRYGAIISTSSAGVIIKDKDGIITDWNIGAQIILGYSPEEMIGQKSYAYTERSQADELEEVYKKVDMGETIADVEIKAIQKNGNQIICSASLSPILDSRGEVNGSVIIFRDITSERLSEQKVRNLAAIVSIADAGIIVKDKDGLVREWNVGAENILGYKAEEIIGNPTEYYSPSRAHSRIHKVEQGLRKGEHFAHVEVVREHRDGRLIDCSASYTPIFDDGEYAGSVAIFHDISDKKRIEYALRDAVFAAKEASKAKSAFLANISHEIRTPMNGVIGFAELALDDDKITPQTRDYFEKIKVSAEGLLHIINAVLDISKIEAGKTEVEKTPFSIQDVFKHCETMFAPKAEEKGILLTSYTELPNTCRLIGDPTKLRQVLLNLLSNAVKFTSSGMIKYIAVVKQADGEHMTVHFEVMDNGIGMTSEQLGKIFDPFIQADVSTTRKYGGTGLGLSIAKSMIELMGGELSAESTVGVGSKFCFDLTFETIEILDAPEVDLRTEKEISKPTFVGDILVCEDNNINQQVIREHLVRIGFNVKIVENGLLGVEAAKSRIENPYDLIFMDIHMPIMDGLKAAVKLREAGVQTPIVALTANAMVEDKEIYLTGGMSGYLTKPFTAKELWACILNYLTPVATETTSATVGQSINPSVPSVIDKELGIELAAGSAELYAGLLVDFVKDNSETIKKIENALSAKDIKLAHRIAHTLKCVAGLIGAIKLKDAARDIEKALSGGDMLDEKLMETLKEELNAVLDELAHTVPSNEQVILPTGELDTRRALDMIFALEPLLEAGDSKCMRLLPEIKEVIAPVGAKGNLLVSQVDNFDFELALATLHDIKSELETDREDT